MHRATVPGVISMKPRSSQSEQAVMWSRSVVTAGDSCDEARLFRTAAQAWHGWWTSGGR